MKLAPEKVGVVADSSAIVPGKIVVEADSLAVASEEVVVEAVLSNCYFYLFL